MRKIKLLNTLVSNVLNVLEWSIVCECSGMPNDDNDNDAADNKSSIQLVGQNLKCICQQVCV